VLFGRAVPLMAIIQIYLCVALSSVMAEGFSRVFQLLAPTTDKGLADHVLTLPGVLNPGTVLPGGLMPQVLRVAAVQFHDPVTVFILVKTQDAGQCRRIPSVSVRVAFGYWLG
jgi:hypothetical protein